MPEHNPLPGKQKETLIDADTRKTVLRMIPYGLYVLTTTGEEVGTGPSTRRRRCHSIRLCWPSA